MYQTELHCIGVKPSKCILSKGDLWNLSSPKSSASPDFYFRGDTNLAEMDSSVLYSKQKQFIGHRVTCTTRRKMNINEWIQNINNANSLSFSLGIGVEVSQAEYNISSEESGKSLFTVTSNLSVTAAKSSHVECLASVPALPSPLRSSVRLTVGERTSCFTLKNIRVHAHICTERLVC